MQSKTGVYTISEEHLSPAILQDVLRWMYLYTISNMPDKVPQLLEAAEYFQMAALKDSCEDILTRQLSVENCVQMMNTAFLFNIPTLKKKLKSPARRPWLQAPATSLHPAMRSCLRPSAPLPPRNYMIAQGHFHLLI